jgi:hypothetical protein
MPIEVTALGSLLGRYTNSVVNEQANESAPLLKGTALKKLKKKDKLGVVNVKAGELASASFLADGGTLPQGRDILPVQGTYFPIPLFERVRIPRLAAETASSTEDAVDIVMEQLSTAGQTLGRLLDRAIIGTQLGSPAATVAVGSTTFQVADPAPFRVGMALEVWNGATAIEGTTEATLIRVTRIALPVDGIGNTTITFSASGALGVNVVQWLTSYTFQLRGSKQAGATMVSLTDVYNTTDLYGIAATGNEWSGNVDTSGVPLTVGAMRSWLTTTVRRRGEKPQFILCNRKNEERYSNQMLNNRRFMSGTMDAVGSSSFEFEGIPLFLDENVGDSDLFFLNNKDVQLHVFRDFAPDFDGGAKKSMDRSAMLVSDSEFVYDLQVWGAYNVRAERRNGGGRFVVNA